MKTGRFLIDTRPPGLTIIPMSMPRTGSVVFCLTEATSNLVCAISDAAAARAVNKRIMHSPPGLWRDGEQARLRHASPAIHYSNAPRYGACSQRRGTRPRPLGRLLARAD